MSPHILYEPSVRRFSFYKNGILHEGLEYNNQLYTLVETFNRQDKRQACLLSTRLGLLGNLTLVTASTNLYRVWMDLQTQRQPVPAASLPN